MSNVPPWQDAVTLCASICISLGTLDNWVAQGLLPPGRKIGGKRLWKWVEVERHLDGPGGELSTAESIRNATKTAIADRNDR